MYKTIPITLDRERNLLFSLNALTDAVEIAGDQIQGFIFGSLTGFSALAALRALLWASLKWEDRRLTLAKAGELLEEEFKKTGNFLEVETRLIEAIVASGLFKEREGNGRPEAPPQAETSGTGSETQEKPVSAPSS